MSSDVDEDQVLPDSLQKLEIVPVYSQSQTACKSNNERNPNPFFSAELSTNATEIAAMNCDDSIIKLFGQKCRNCENNEGGCNAVTATTKDSTSSKNWRSHRTNGANQCSSSIEHGIQKQIHFKQRDKEKTQTLSTNKKLTILRDPILKYTRSLHHNFNSSASKPCCDGIAQTASQFDKIKDNISGAAAVSSTTVAAAISFEIRNSNDSNNFNNLPINRECRRVPSTAADQTTIVMTNLFDDNKGDDFKSLVNDCRNMTLTANVLDSSNSTIELHKTKNFQVLQSNVCSSATVATASTTNTPNTGGSSNSNFAIPSTSGSANNGNVNVMNTSSSSNSSNSSSCSQQARMNSANCDVTIDELASYFETFVHIPKKMSSMAEMMYI